MITGNFESKATLLDKVVVTTDGAGAISLDTEENGAISIKAEDCHAGLKIETVDGKEIADATITFDGKATANLEERSIEISGGSTQTVTLAQKIKLSLEERANARVDTNAISVTLEEAKAELNDKELANVNGNIKYEYDQEDPTGEISVSILGGEPITKSGEIRIISTIRNLLTRMPALAN